MQPLSQPTRATIASVRAKPRNRRHRGPDADCLALDIISRVIGNAHQQSYNSATVVPWRFVCALGISLVLMTACSAPAPAPADQRQATSKGESLSPAAAALRARLTNTENGLEVRRWVIADQIDRIASAMRTHGIEWPPDASRLESLKRNGLRFVRIPVNQIDALLADLGGASYDATEWHGQVAEWRSLGERPIDPAGQAVAVDGQVQRYHSGEFRLMIRSWNVLMESGPYLHFELSPRHRVVQANNLRKLFEREGDLEQFYGSMSLDLQLESGYAYVLMGEAPHIAWFESEGTSGAGEPLASERSAARRNSLDMGPEAVAPPTLGELLLSSSSAADSRGVLVIVPKIAVELFLPEHLAAREQARQNANAKGAGGT